MFVGLHTIWATVADMDRGVAFYRDTLGLELVYGSPFWSSFRLGDGLLGLHSALEGIEPGGETGKGWMLPLQVENVQRLKAHLEASGVAVGEYHETPSGLLFGFEDPDGNPIQAIQVGIRLSSLTDDQEQ